MKIVSLNVGLPREVVWRGRTVSTGIYKAPVEGRRAMRRTNLDGDRQADLTVHGGASKAVYCYPYEHYDWWTKELGRQLPIGMFGENLTVEGLNEASVHVGDRFAVGTARIVVTQPRMPCYKLGIRFDDDDMVQRFLDSGRTGFYVAVEQEGEVGAGDEIVMLERDPNRVRVADMPRLYAAKRLDASELEIVKRALQVTALSQSWKDHFAERLARRDM